MLKLIYRVGIVSLLFSILSTPSFSKDLRVNNAGFDSSFCGSRNTPCASISQAIDNANAGDQIIVSAGRYGDLNGNGVFGELGEEWAEPSGLGSPCMINIDKTVRVVSQAGSAVTQLDAGVAPQVQIVCVHSSDVVFGARNKGFSLIRSNGAGFVMAAGLSNVKVSGNRALSTGSTGFSIIGSNHVVSYNYSQAKVNDGFHIGGTGHLVIHNSAISSRSSGFRVNGDHILFKDNLAISNREFGFHIPDGEGLLLEGNTIVGNRFFGIESGDNAVTVLENNIYGNNGVEFIWRGESFINCGVNSANGSMIATNNFWGDATGPGEDPADAACNLLPPAFIPFSTNGFKVKGGP